MNFVTGIVRLLMIFLHIIYLIIGVISPEIIDFRPEISGTN